jgi:hypothetical protein
MINVNSIDMLFDKKVVDKDDDRIGTVGQVFVSRRDGHPTWATVRTGLFGNKETFVPLDSASYDDDVLRVAFDKHYVKDAPRVDTEGALTPDEEDELYRYYSVEEEHDDEHQHRGGLFHRDRDDRPGAHADDSAHDERRHDRESDARTGKHVAGSAAAAGAAGTAESSQRGDEDGLGHRGLGGADPDDDAEAERSTLEHRGLGGGAPGDATRARPFDDDAPDSATRDAGLGSEIPGGGERGRFEGRDDSTRDEGLGSPDDDTATDLAGSDVSGRDPLAYDPVHEGVQSGDDTAAGPASNLDFDRAVNERGLGDTGATGTEGSQRRDNLGRDMSDPSKLGLGGEGGTRESRMKRWSSGDQR